MKKCGLSAVVVLLVAGSSQAAGGVSLDLTLIGRTSGTAGVLPWGAASKGVSVDTSGGARTVRFEVRFSFHDSNLTDNIANAGLAGTAFDLRSTIPAASGATIGFGRIPPADNNDGAPARDDPIISGVFNPAGPGGLPNAYRPNIGNNGRLGAAPDGNLGTLADFPVIPLSVSTPANTPVDGARYFLYCFNITLPAGFAAGTYTVNLANLDQAGIYYGLTDDGAELGIVGLDSTISSSSTVTLNVIPAPASAALLSLSGLVAARRRRN